MMRIMKMAKRKPNKYKMDGDTLILYNNKDNREMYFDVEDFDLITQYTWCIDKRYAAARVTTSKGIYKIKLAHRLLMNDPIGMLVDHINTNGLDNRKSNLRIATDQVNQHNRKAKGYTWDKKNKKWKAHIGINGKVKNLGLYKTEAEARAAYLAAKKIYHPTAPTHLWQ